MGLQYTYINLTTYTLNTTCMIPGADFDKISKVDIFKHLCSCHRYFGNIILAPLDVLLCYTAG